MGSQLESAERHFHNAGFTLSNLCCRLLGKIILINLLYLSSDFIYKLYSDAPLNFVLFQYLDTSSLVITELLKLVAFLYRSGAGCLIRPLLHIVDPRNELIAVRALSIDIGKLRFTWSAL